MKLKVLHHVVTFTDNVQVREIINSSSSLLWQITILFFYNVLVLFYVTNPTRFNMKFKLGQ